MADAMARMGNRVQARIAAKQAGKFRGMGAMGGNVVRLDSKLEASTLQYRGRGKITVSYKVLRLL